MEKPLLTIGMVAYNEEKYISQAIKSLLAQTFKDFILLISDNASNDKTQEICQEYAKKDNRIVYVRQNKNLGTIANWRYVVGKTDTPYFMLCAGHDLWDPCYVEKLLPAFKDKNVVVSYPQSRSIEADGTEGKVLKDDYSMDNIEKSADRYLYLLRRYRAPNVFFSIWRTEAIKNCDLTLKSPTTDIMILEQLALEGKFKQYQEVLFWLRVVRKEEGHDQMVRRQIAVARGKPIKEVTIFEIRTYYIIYVIESIKIIFRKHYALNILTKIWLVVNVIFLKLLYPYAMFGFGAVIKFIFGNKIFYKLQNYWHKNQYQIK